MTTSWFAIRSDEPFERSSAPPSERTRLLEIHFPSPGSTGRPSQSNLEEHYIENYEAVEEEVLLLDGPSSRPTLEHDDERSNASSLELFTPLYGEDEIEEEQQQRKKGPSSLLSRFLPILGFVTIGVLITHWWHRAVSQPEPSGPTRNDTSPQLVEVPQPLSRLHPVDDLGLYSIPRGAESYPHEKVLRENREAVPTHAWYQNLMEAPDNPSYINRAYSIPHVVDAVGPIPGLRIMPPHIDGTQSVVQLSTVDDHGLTLGASSARGTVEQLSHGYSVRRMTNLGVTLQWDVANMTSSIVKGMPFATMQYKRSFDKKDPLPAIASSIGLLEDPLVDRVTSISCDVDKNNEPVAVQRELQLKFKASDFTWVVFFSEPVRISCSRLEGTSGVVVRVQEPVDPTIYPEDHLIVRAAFLNNCTTGSNPIYCRNGKSTDSEIEAYADLLRRASLVHPGENTSVSYSVDVDTNRAKLLFDWDVQNTTRRLASLTNDTYGYVASPLARHLRSRGEEDMDTPFHITFALPHHLDRLNNSMATPRFCTPTLIGETCLVHGTVWELDEPLMPIDFRAPRQPDPKYLSDLISATSEDLGYRLPGYFLRGAGDTYFSAKMLARQARVLLIAEELQELCRSKHQQKKHDCASVAHRLPVSSVESTLRSLRDGISIWINGSAEVPFVYDEAWGGLISCGCHFDGDTESCSNKFPDCPCISDPGLNFGNGFYNDHHFHYGYMIYAAAVVTHFDPQWGADNFEALMLLVRDIANPSLSDARFPLYRHKDWFSGHSWASGISRPAYLNGKNQESSSEAIAAYEAVALLGDALKRAAKPGDNIHNVANELSIVGRIMTATEIRSTDRYWHVRQHDKSKKVYPDMYYENAVGILWNTMAQFQTWFGNAPYLPYGIQLLPITPVSEFRDDPDWVREMYQPFADACNSDTHCEEDGWSVLQLAMMASAGRGAEAAARLKNLSSAVFETAGGNGHSRSNTLWYIATRPEVADPISLPLSDTNLKQRADCGVPETCTKDVLNTYAGSFTCRDRIDYLISAFSKSEEQACAQVGGVEYPNECGGCKPDIVISEDEAEYEFDASQCEACTEEQCKSDLNRCPVYDRTFVCTQGPSTGGCAPHPWDVKSQQCHGCCELTACESGLVPGEVSNHLLTDEEESESNCPPCTHEVCHARTTLCPVQVAPYLCTEGLSNGGCAPTPWVLDHQCHECCKLSPDC